MELKIGKYQHYKGRTFEVIAIGMHHDTLEEFAIYKSLEDSEVFSAGTVWVRPTKAFFEAVIVEGKEIPHFIFLED
jgi:hypothetical protein